MPYTQHFGLSRKSPLNAFGETSEKKKEEENEVSEQESDAPADNIIQQNTAGAESNSSFADVGEDIVNQLKDKWKSKSILGKIDMAGRAIVSQGKSLIGEVDTSKLDSDKLDEAQDYTTITSGAVGLTGWGQIPSIAMDVANTAFSGKRAFDHFMSGNKKEGWKHVGKGGLTAATIVPGVGEYKALQTTGKYSKKAMTAADRLGGDVEGGVPTAMISTMSAPMKLSQKISGWLARKFSD